MSLKRKKKNGFRKLAETKSKITYVEYEDDEPIIKYSVYKGWEKHPIETWTHEFTERAIDNALEDEQEGLGLKRYEHFTDSDGVLRRSHHTYAHVATAMTTPSYAHTSGQSENVKRLNGDEFFIHFKDSLEKHRKLMAKYPNLQRVFNEWNKVARKLKFTTTRSERQKVVNELVRLYKVYRKSLPESMLHSMERMLKILGDMGYVVR